MAYSGSQKTRLGLSATPRGAVAFSAKVEQETLIGICGTTNWAILFPPSGNITPLTAGAVAGTGTVVLQSSHQSGGGLGGVLITADSSNDATVVVRKNNASGEVIFDLSTAIPQFVSQNILVEDTSVIYYSISGTNAQAMLYEYAA